MNIFRLPFSALGRTLKQPGILLTLYVVTLALSVPLASAFQNVAWSAAGNSRALEALLTDFSYTEYSDFMKLYGDRFAALMNVALSLGVVFLLLNSFFAGGILATLQGPKRRFSLTSFLGACAAYWGRFLRLLILFSASAVVVLGLIALAFGGAMAVIANSAETELPIIACAAAGVTLALLVTCVLLMIVDYAKVIAVDTSNHRMIAVALEAVRFVGRNFLRALLLHLILLALALLCIVLYWVVEDAIGMTSIVTIGVMALIQQALIIGRIWFRVAYFAAETGLYQSVQLRKAPAVDAPLPPVEPQPLLA